MALEALRRRCCASMGSGATSSSCCWRTARKSATVAAYTHAEHVAERKRALQFLADRIDKLAAGAEVVQLSA